MTNQVNNTGPDSEQDANLNGPMACWDCGKVNKWVIADDGIQEYRCSCGVYAGIMG